MMLVRPLAYTGNDPRSVQDMPWKITYNNAFIHRGQLSYNESDFFATGLSLHNSKNVNH